MKELTTSFKFTDSELRTILYALNMAGGKLSCLGRPDNSYFALSRKLSETKQMQKALKEGIQ